MPAKPVWYSKINDIVRELEALPYPFVDRAAVEFLFGVGRRRAQQIMAPAIVQRVGANGLADRDALIAHLIRPGTSDAAYYERRRRRNVAEVLTQLQKERRERPQLLVEAPVGIVSQEFETLPPGVQVEPGRITVDFERAQEALEKLLALSMAIANDFMKFERLISRVPDKPQV